MNFVCDVKANKGLFLKILLMGDNFESVLDAEVLCSVIEHGLSLNGDLSWEEWLDDGGDLWEDQGLGAVGVLVSVESGVKGEGAGLASWGEGFAVLGGDQSQKVIGVVLAGSDADGKSRDLEIRLIIQPSYFQGQGLQSSTISFWQQRIKHESLGWLLLEFINLLLNTQQSVLILNNFE